MLTGEQPSACVPLTAVRGRHDALVHVLVASADCSSELQVSSSHRFGSQYHSSMQQVSPHWTRPGWCLQAGGGSIFGKIALHALLAICSVVRHQMSLRHFQHAMHYQRALPHPCTPAASQVCLSIPHACVLVMCSMPTKKRCMSTTSAGVCIVGISWQTHCVCCRFNRATWDVPDCPVQTLQETLTLDQWRDTRRREAWGGHES